MTRSSVLNWLPALLCSLLLCGPVHASDTLAASDPLRLIVTQPLPAESPLANLAPSGRIRYLPASAAEQDAKAARQANLLAADVGAELEARWPIHALGIDCLVLRVAADRRDDVQARLGAMPGVDVQPMHLFHMAAAAGKSDGLASAHDAGSSRSATGRGISIAVIDTGADLGHAALSDARIRAVDLVDNHAPDSLPAERHGTAIVGLLASSSQPRLGVAGLAPDATVLLLRACWEEAGADASCNTFTLAKALAAAHAADVAVVNLSLVGPRDALLEALAGRLVEQGKLLVVAGEHREQFPGSIAGSLLAIEHVDRSEQLMTLLPGDRFGLQSGSSLAAAELTAMLARLRERQPQLPGTELLSGLARMQDTD